MKTILEGIKERRSIYVLDDEKVLNEDVLEKIVKVVTKCVPSPFNMQSQRVVLLTEKHHKKLWSIVLETLRKTVPTEKFEATEAKINKSFGAGYATILYFEDQAIVEKMGNQFPKYKENFETWSEHGNAMLQYALWTALEAEGLGASLQHYNPLIDDEVKETWNLPEQWKLIAQMPLGKAIAPAEEKTFIPIDEKVKVFK